MIGKLKASTTKTAGGKPVNINGQSRLNIDFKFNGLTFLRRLTFSLHSELIDWLSIQY